MGVENAGEKNWLVAGSAPLKTPWEPNNDGCERDKLPNVQQVETKEGTMMLPAEGPAENPGEELMGKEDEHVFADMLPVAVTFDAMSWLVWFCTAARI